MSSIETLPLACFEPVDIVLINPRINAMPEQRTPNGCWTCRLRRLKCDEGLDNCNQCTRQGIPCAGYSREKPDWKDGGVKEAEKLETVKSLISRKRKRDRQQPRQPSQSGEPTVISNSGVVTSPDSIALTQRSASNGEMSHPCFAFNYVCESPGFGSQQLLSPLPLEDSDKNTSASSAREDELLMHYLDYVFTLQFRHHKYAANFLSRGWLFSLVKRITPLRHSVLSLSALHQHHLQQQGILSSSQDDSLQELQDHHAAALSQLRQFIRDQTSESMTDNHVPILACCVQLISFDLFQGGNKEWHMHLHAANLLIKNHIEFIGPGSPSEHQFHQDIASNFCTGALIWFDIFSSATTGKKPTLYGSHQRLLKSRPPLVNLENIMGCENSVMVLIGKISVLKGWKSEQQLKGSLSIWALVDKARWILEALECEIERLETILDVNAGTKDGNWAALRKAHQVYVATNIFACAAVVYLQTVVCGFYQSLPEIKSGVEMTITAMKRIKEDDAGPLARSLVWPAVIAGCLADETQAEFFRAFLSAGSDNAYGFGNCHIAKDVLETCWEQSRASSPKTGEVWSWSQAMQHLGYLVLLV